MASYQVFLVLPVLTQSIRNHFTISSECNLVTFYSLQATKGNRVIQRSNSQTEGETAVNPLPTAKLKQVFSNTNLELLSPSTTSHLSLQDLVHFPYCKTSHRREPAHFYKILKFWDVFSLKLNK